jgi:hypothetical protein
MFILRVLVISKGKSGGMVNRKQIACKAAQRGGMSDSGLRKIACH